MCYKKGYTLVIHTKKVYLFVSNFSHIVVLSLAMDIKKKTWSTNCFMGVSNEIMESLMHCFPDAVVLK